MSGDLMEQRRLALIAEVHAGFEGVTREGGVSWTETGAIDSHGDEAERASARTFDKDTNWIDLIDDSAWKPEEQYWGGFSFLDSIGTRYYLAPLMIRALRDGPCEQLFDALHLTTPNDSRHAAWWTEKLSALTDRQRRCIAAFVRLLLDLRRNQERPNDSDLMFLPWDEAYDRYWRQFDT